MLQQIRDDIVAYIDAPYRAAYPEVPMVFDNAPFDRNDPPPFFVEVAIEFHGGSQVGVAAQPKTRIRGHVYVNAWVRAGRGRRDALAALDWVANLIKYTHIGTAQLQAPDPDGSSEPPGWYVEHTKVAFYSDPA